MSDWSDEFFGKPIHCYSRAHAIRDGVLADLSSLLLTGRPIPTLSGIRHPVAVTNAVWHRCILGAADIATPKGVGEMVLAVSAFCELLAAQLRRARGTNTDVVFFECPDLLALADRAEPLELWAKSGPGDTFEPVITVMLRSED